MLNQKMNEKNKEKVEIRTKKHTNTDENIFDDD